MKKAIVFVLAAVLVLCCIASASASTSFSWSGSTTSGFPRWGDDQTSSGAKWHIDWDSSSNISSSRRAVVRILSNGNYASSLFVYSTLSSNYHPYKDGYGYGLADTYIAGRLDDRDSGTLTVSGTFYN